MSRPQLFFDRTMAGETTILRRRRIFGIIFAVSFSLLSCMCSSYQTALVIGRRDLPKILINSMFLTPFVYTAYCFFRKVTIRLSEAVHIDLAFEKGDWKYFAKCTVATMILLLPVWLAYYPGFNNYDAYNQIKQGVLIDYSQWHPIAHTFWLKFFLYTVGGSLLKNYTVGWAIGMLCQMSLASLSIAYMHLLIYRLGVGKKIRAVLIVFLGLVPIVPLTAISSTKDVIFGCFFLLSCICMCYWALQPELFKKKRFVFLYLLSLLGTMLFRNNGVYGLVLALVVGSAFFAVKKQWRFLVITSFGIVLGCLSLNGLQLATKSPEVNYNEAMSVPYQQLAYVYMVKGYELEEKTKEEIKYMIPEVEKYKSNYADMIKFSGRALTNEDGIGRFLKLYIGIGVKYPLYYIEAFIQQNMGYLYVLDKTSSEIQASGAGGWGGYMETELRPLHEEAGGVLECRSFLPGLKAIYEKLFSYNEYKSIIPLFISCSLGFYFWLIILTAFIGFELKARGMAIVLANIAGFLLTIFLGPMVAVRYAFPYVLAVPVLYITVVGNLAKRWNTGIGGGGEG